MYDHSCALVLDDRKQITGKLCYPKKGLRPRFHPRAALCHICDPLRVRYRLRGVGWLYRLDRDQHTVHFHHSYSVEGSEFLERCIGETDHFLPQTHNLRKTTLKNHFLQLRFSGLRW